MYRIAFHCYNVAVELWGRIAWGYECWFNSSSDCCGHHLGYVVWSKGVCLMCRLRNEAASREFAERQRINESRLQHSSNDEPKRQSRKSSDRRTCYCQENDELWAAFFNT